MSDLIDRQTAISAICNACGKIDCDKMDKCEKLQLPPANCSEFPNNSDTISRQDAIDALDKRFDNVPMEQTTEILLLRKDLRELPSAQKPFKLPEIFVAEGFDTIEDEDGNIGFGVYAPAENQIYVVGDVEDEIRARALLHEVCHWVQAMCGRPFDEDEANEFSDIVYDALPSVQTKEVIPHRNYKYLSDYWCECGNHLGKKGDVKYCSDCGKKVKWDG